MIIMRVLLLLMVFMFLPAPWGINPCAAVDFVPGPQERLLVVAPHPDDEVLSAGGLMQRVKSSGGDVRVLYLTSGDGAFLANPVSWVRGSDIRRRLGTRRMGEAVDALSVLGFDDEASVFFGFPDRGLIPIWRNHLQDESAYWSRRTRSKHVFYYDLKNHGSPYVGSALLEAIQVELMEFNPTMVMTPVLWDSHPDHKAANLFVKAALAGLPIRPRIYSYVVHYPKWSTVMHRSPAEIAAFLPGAKGESIRTFSLTREETRRKRRSIKSNQTQRPSINRFLLKFANHQEVLFEDPLVALDLGETRRYTMNLIPDLVMEITVSPQGTEGVYRYTGNETVQMKVYVAAGQGKTRETNLRLSRRNPEFRWEAPVSDQRILYINLELNRTGANPVREVWSGLWQLPAEGGSMTAWTGTEMASAG